MDSETSKSKKEKYKSLALIAWKVSSDEDASCLDSNDEQYAMTLKRRKKIKGALNAVIQITSLVIVLNTPSTIKKHSLVDVGVKVMKRAYPRRKKFVSWRLKLLSDTLYYSSSSID
ncbi:hypothetical protein Tco_0372394, partial [Tanacetum coccineum]